MRLPVVLSATPAAARRALTLVLLSHGDEGDMKGARLSALVVYERQREDGWSVSDARVGQERRRPSLRGSGRVLWHAGGGKHLAHGVFKGLSPEKENKAHGNRGGEEADAAVPCTTYLYSYKPHTGI